MWSFLGFASSETSVSSPLRQCLQSSSSCWGFFGFLQGKDRVKTDLVQGLSVERCQSFYKTSTLDFDPLINRSPKRARHKTPKKHRIQTPAAAPTEIPTIAAILIPLLSSSLVTVT